MKTKKDDENYGMVLAANHSLSTAIQELATSILDCNQAMTEAQFSGATLNAQGVEAMEYLDTMCEEFSMTWAQYQQEILGIDTGLGETELEDY